MAVNAKLYNDHGSENRYFYKRNSAGVWSETSGSPVAPGGSQTNGSSDWAMGISTAELIAAEITDDSIFDDGLYVDVSRNSFSPYSNTNMLNYANATSTGNPQNRNGGLLFARSYNCIAADREEAPFTKEYLNDVAPDGTFTYYKMTRQEDINYIQDNGTCTIRPAPLRSLLGGVPSLRGQSDEQFYKITLGDTVLNSS